MFEKLNQLLDVLSDFFAQRKGLLPILGILFILLNVMLQFTTLTGWLKDTNLFLHIGAIIAIIGFMLAWAL